ncbi:hypothetical protein B5M19_02340 [Mesomycoplasma hyopneumoniae]|uniref:Uncharacterized protein n=3 Tax=Mesomycoplasma hyopneumoniae TaxID=2099 RepID=E4QSL5_MESH1|nr:Predicted protein [Mesomycoplasma hyopneumoniae 168]AGM21992.1 hypothetical protein MHP168L_211 [Mesomycoplasma hyopneumoniae 168-L]MCI8283253.1 hypothetical protein [Mesomycoplasma hyopneumoniae]MCI8298185.1 hypothetical protein [Mesomycoplasma hyopneumoniae]MXR10178.1 hypothetical protein [Mesomycoplasma hyopneumoniae]
MQAKNNLSQFVNMIFSYKINFFAFLFLNIFSRSFSINKIKQILNNKSINCLPFSNLIII